MDDVAGGGSVLAMTQQLFGWVTGLLDRACAPPIPPTTGPLARDLDAAAGLGMESLDLAESLNSPRGRAE